MGERGRGPTARWSAPRGQRPACSRRQSSPGEQPFGLACPKGYGRAPCMPKSNSDDRPGHVVALRRMGSDVHDKGSDLPSTRPAPGIGHVDATRRVGVFVLFAVLPVLTLVTMLAVG